MKDSGHDAELLMTSFKDGRGLPPFVERFVGGLSPDSPMPERDKEQVRSDDGMKNWSMDKTKAAARLALKTAATIFLGYAVVYVVAATYVVAAMFAGVVLGGLLTTYLLHVVGVMSGPTLADLSRLGEIVLYWVADAVGHVSRWFISMYDDLLVVLGTAPPNP